MSIEEKLKAFGEYLLEKEMAMAREISERDYPPVPDHELEAARDAFYDGAFTWINAIRHEFKERFKDHVCN